MKKIRVPAFFCTGGKTLKSITFHILVIQSHIRTKRKIDKKKRVSSIYNRIACCEQDPHRYYKTLQNPTKIKKTSNI